MHFHIKKVQPLTGFAMAAAEAGERAWVLTQAVVTSDDPMFHTYINQFTNIFLAPLKVMVDQVSQFLVVIHEDSTADVYINDFVVQVRMRPKRDVKALELITANDIVDITHHRSTISRTLDSSNRSITRLICLLRAGELE